MGDLDDLLALDAYEAAELDAWNRTEHPFDDDALIDDLIVQSAISTANPACIFDGRSVSRAALFDAAHQLAAALQLAGARPGVIVAIALPAGIDRIVAVLATLRTGAAFMPLDIELPRERQRFQLDDSGSTVLVTEPGPLVVEVAKTIRTITLPLNSAPGPLTPVPRRHATDWAYLTYTSGSTGRPKAATNTHRALVNRLRWMVEDLGTTADDCVLHKTSFGFDVAVWEQLLPLLVGATLVICPESGRGDATAIATLIDAHRVTLCHFVPTLLSAFVEAAPAISSRSLRTIVCSGEDLARSVASAAVERFRCSLRNYYGPTEAAIDVVAWSYDPDGRYRFVPIGRPIWNVRAYVLDSELQRVPPGVIGELYIAGVCLGDGYLGRPGLTATRFVPDPFSSVRSQRLYRTGDLVRIHDGGELEFLGRTDTQVKVRGHRIELGEIEECLRQHPTVRQAAAVVRQTAGHAKQLAAYVVGPRRHEAQELIRWLRERLPEWMVPTTMTALSRLPTTANGKLDRAALPDPSQASPRTPTKPQGPIEGIIAEVWGSLLDLGSIDATLDFFQAGGDSVLAIRLVARCRARGVVFAIRDVFVHPTIRGLARVARREHPDAAREHDPAQRLWAEARAQARAIAAPIGRFELAPSVADALESTLARMAAALVGRGNLAQPDAAPFRLHGSMDLSGDELEVALADEVATDTTMVFVAARVAPRPDTHQQSVVIAFDPARLDHESLMLIPALLDPAGAGLEPHRFDASVWTGTDVLPTATRSEPDVLPLDVSAPRHAQALLNDLEPELDSTAAELRLDWLTGLVAHAAVAESGGEVVRLVTPESRSIAARSGYSTANLVGRIGLCCTTVLSPDDVHDLDTAARTVARVRAGEVHVHELESRRVIRVSVSSPRVSSGGVTLLEGPCVATAATARRKEVSVTVGPDRLHWSWSAELGDWPEHAARLAAASYMEARQAFGRRPWTRSTTGTSCMAAGSMRLGGPTDADVLDAYPLTPTQEGLLMRALYWPGSDAYLNQNVIELRGELDIGALARAWDSVVERYEVLRTGFVWEGRPRPLQYVARRAIRSLEALDWRDTDESAVEARLQRHLEEDRAQLFDLTEAGLCRLVVARVTDSHSILIWTHHHILLDGWCLSLIWGDVFRFYAHDVAGEPAPRGTPRPFRDYVAWLRHRTVSDVDRRFWREWLAGFEQPTLLSRKPPQLEGTVSTLRITLPEVRVRALERSARSAGVTTNAYVQTAWALLVARASGATDLVHGVSVSGRPPELVGAEGMVGLFINAIPLRTKLAYADTMLDLVRRTQAALAEASGHLHVPLAEIMSQWEGRGTPDARLFDSLIAFENYPEDNLPTGAIAGLEIRDRFCDEKTEYPIGLIVLPGPPMELHFNFDQAHFAPQEVQELADDFFALLDIATDQPGLRVEQLSHRASEARLDGLDAWSFGGEAHPDEDLLARIEAIAKAWNDRAAVTCGDETWTYQGLCAAVDRLAAVLAPAHDARVAILAERSFAYVVAVLAAWKVGAVPELLNPAYPDRTLAEIVGRSGVHVVLTSVQQSPRAAAWGSRMCIVERVIAEPRADVGACDKVQPLAAVLYTSGTSGRPKGVVLTRAGLVNRLRATEALYEVERPRLLANAAPGFDIGLWELLFPLVRGGTLVLARDREMLDPEALLMLVERHQISVLHAVPSLAHAITSVAAAADASSLRVIIVGGEVVAPTLVLALGDRYPSARIWQGYGPSEASISVTDQRCGVADTAGERVPLGRPTAGCRVYVLDELMRPCPPGTVGELYVAGVCLSVGYDGWAGGTAAAFVPDPFGPAGSRMYRTGDRGSWRADRRLEFRERRDRQLKIRGHRVEPTVVEGRLMAHLSVGRATVAMKLGPPGELVAFVVLRESAGDPTEVEQLLRPWLAETLPSWCLPSEILAVPELPLTPTGKVDVQALLTSARASRVASVNEGFESELERTIASTWLEVTGVALPHRHASFFAHGGHSLVVMHFALTLRSRLGPDARVPVPLVFKCPTPRSLAEALLVSVDGSGVDHVHVLARGSGPPLVLIHPVEGTSFGYRVVPEQLPGTTIIAIDDPRFGLAQGFDSMREMAVLYAEWIRALTDDGPVVLGGWSFGGAVALAIAELMADHGTRPAGVVLLDSYNLCGRVDMIANAGLGGAALAELERHNPAAATALRQEIRRNAILATASTEPRFDGPVMLLLAQPDEAVVRDIGPENGWTREHLPRLELERSVAQHHDLLRPPHLSATIAAIRPFLERVTRGAHERG